MTLFNRDDGFSIKLFLKDKYNKWFIFLSIIAIIAALSTFLVRPLSLYLGYTGYYNSVVREYEILLVLECCISWLLLFAFVFVDKSEVVYNKLSIIPITMFAIIGIYCSISNIIMQEFYWEVGEFGFYASIPFFLIFIVEFVSYKKGASQRNNYKHRNYIDSSSSSGYSKFTVFINNFKNPTFKLIKKIYMVLKISDIVLIILTFISFSIFIVLAVIIDELYLFGLLIVIFVPLIVLNMIFRKSVYLLLKEHYAKKEEQENSSYNNANVK